MIILTKVSICRYPPVTSTKDRAIFGLQDEFQLYLLSFTLVIWFSQKYSSLQYIFSKYFRCNLTFKESRNVSNLPLSITLIFDYPKIFRSPFCMKNSLTCMGSEIRKIKLQKILGIFLDKLRKLNIAFSREQTTE